MEILIHLRRQNKAHNLFFIILTLAYKANLQKGFHNFAEVNWHDL
jgi:hypothetical protein